MAQEMLILSPEKTVLSFNIARLGSRVYAQLLDVFILISLLILLSVIFQSLGSFGAPIMMVLLSIGPFLYFILLEGLWNGQTLGKKALSIRVRMGDGTPITFAAALGRNLLRPADFLPMGYFLGMLAVFTNERSQRLGDRVANTIVLHDKRAEPRFSPAPYVLGVHPFEEHVGELRGMNNEEYVALKRMCDRFPELSANVQERLIAEVWYPLQAKYGISPVSNVHPVYLAEAVVMKYGRRHGLL
jgi:uncharacterized RDD family membrane protein YckC